jgi:hypothetical protein
MRDREPSGRTSRRSSAPCRRIQPRTGKAWPSNGCRGRTIVTAAGTPSRGVVCRRVVRPTGSPGPARHPGRAHPRRPLPAAHRGAARRRVSGELAVPRHAQQRAARRGGEPPPREHLPRPVGSVRRDDLASSIQPRDASPAQPGVRAPDPPRYRPPADGAPPGGPTGPRPGAAAAVDRPGRPGLSPAALCPLRGRCAPRV